MAPEYRETNTFAESALPWVVCFCAALFFFYEFLQGNMFASLADNIMHDFHIKADKMSWLSSSYYLSNVIFLLIAGLALDKYSTKKIIMIAMLLCVLSTFVMASTYSFYLAMFCRFVIGIGSAFCFLGPIRLASRWFPPRKMAMVTGAIVTIGMTGGMLAQYPLTKLVAQIGWREALMQVGYLGVVLLGLMYFGIIDKSRKDTSTVKEDIKVSSLIKQVYLNSQILRAALYSSLMNMTIAVFGAMMGTLYLVQRLGVSKEEAAIVNSMLFLGALIGGPCIGWYSDKIGRRVLPMKIGVIASSVILVIIIFCPVPISVMKVLFLLLGFFTTAQIISYALVAERSPPSLTATAVGVVSLFVQGGYIVYQNIFGLLLTAHGEMQMLNGTPVYSMADYQHAAIILPLGLLLAYFALSGLKESNGQQLEG